MTSFVQKLEAACQANRSLLCVGLDPDPRLMPTADIFAFNRAIVDATRDLVCTFKPNLSFYEAQGLEGLKALEQTVDHIRSVSPEVVVVGDAKRGDVSSSSAAYATAMFDHWGFDAVTVNGYLGRDSVEPFLAHEGRGVLYCVKRPTPAPANFRTFKTKTACPCINW